MEPTKIKQRSPAAPSPAESRAIKARIRFTASCVGILSALNVAAFAIKLLPPQSSPLLEFIRQDTYYCVLLPLSLPILAFFNYLLWLCYSFFTNN